MKKKIVMIKLKLVKRKTTCLLELKKNDLEDPSHRDLILKALEWNAKLLDRGLGPKKKTLLKKENFSAISAALQASERFELV